MAHGTQSFIGFGFAQFGLFRISFKTFLLFEVCRTASPYCEKPYIPRRYKGHGLNYLVLNSMFSEFAY